VPVPVVLERIVESIDSADTVRAETRLRASPDNRMYLEWQLWTRRDVRALAQIVLSEEKNERRRK
jgi:hypothetical protein